MSENGLSSAVFTRIDRAIKEVWIHEIADDYRNGVLLKEDSLKGAFYHHLRNRLDAVLMENGLRIYPEFDEIGLREEGKRIDLAVVKIEDKPQDGYDLNDMVIDVAAVIEFKYKKSGRQGTDLIFKDIEKVKGYIRRLQFDKCQYYLGMIHEHQYPKSQLQWLERKQVEGWAAGKVTELNACRFDEFEKSGMGFTVMSYNNMNEDLNWCNGQQMVFAHLEPFTCLPR